MDIPWKTVLFWTPRVLGFLFAGFVSLFALDVFNDTGGIGKMLVHLAIHLIPTFLILGAVAISWRWEWLGGVLCLALAAYYVVSTKGHMHLATYVLIAGPLVVIGLLFLVDWLYRWRVSAAS
jgi:hypothetical protein